MTNDTKENLLYYGDNKKPYVSFKTSGTLIMSGIFTIACKDGFHTSIMEWIRWYVNNSAKKTVFIFHPLFFPDYKTNLFEIFKEIESLKNIEIVWFTENEDDIEDAKWFKGMVKTENFTIKEIGSDDKITTSFLEEFAKSCL